MCPVGCFQFFTRDSRIGSSATTFANSKGNVGPEVPLGFGGLDRGKERPSRIFEMTATADTRIVPPSVRQEKATLEHSSTTTK